MTALRTALRWSLRLAAVAAAAFALAAGGTAALLAARGGQAIVAAWAIARIEGGGVKVTVARTDGAWPRDIVLEGIELRDRDGPWLTVDRLALRLKLAPLLRARIDAERLDVGTIRLLRLPAGAPAGSAAAPFDPAVVARSLRRAVVREAHIEALRADREAFGTAVAAAVTASLVREGGGPHLRADLRQEAAEGRLALDLRADRTALTLRLAGTWGPLTADAHLGAVFKGETAGEIKLACAAPCPAGGSVDLGDASVQAILSGTVQHPSLAFELRAEGPRADRRALRRIAGRGTLVVAADRTRVLQLQAQGTLEGARAALPEIAAVLADGAEWSVSARRDRDGVALDGLTVTSGDTSARLAATITPQGFTPATLTVDLRGGGRLLGLAGDRSATSAEVILERAARDGTAGGRLHLRASGLAVPAALRGVIGPDLSVDSAFAVDPAALRFTEARLASGQAALSGESTWTRQGPRTDHEATRLAVTVDAAALVGAPAPVEGSIALRGPLAGLTGDLRARIAAVPLGASEVREIVVAGEVRRRGAGFAASVSADGQWRDRPLALRIDFDRVAAGALAVPRLHLASAAGTVDGALVIEAATANLAGRLTARVTDLAGIGAIVETPLGGAGNATLTLAADRGAQKVEANVALDRFAAAGYAADRLTARATVNDARGTPRLRVAVEGRGGALLGRPLKRLSASAAGPIADIAIELEASGTETFSATAAGRIDASRGATLALARLRLRDGSWDARLLAPTRLSASADAMRLETTRIAVADGTITVDGSLDRARGTVAASIAAAGLSPRALAEGADEMTPTNMRIDASATLAGPVSAVNVDAALAASFDTVGGRRGRLGLKAAVRDSRAAVTGDTEGLSTEAAQLAADFPLRLDLAALRATLDMDQPVRGRLRWNGDVAPLWRLLPFDDHRLAGSLAVDLAAEGSLREPVLRGTVRLADGGYENIPESLVLQRVNATLGAESASAFAVAIDAADRHGGTLTARGSLARDDTAAAWVADIAATLDNLAAVNRDDLTATLSGNLAYKGPLAAGTLTGRLAVREAELRIDQGGPPPVPLLRTLETPAEAAARRQPGRVPRRDVALDLDVAVDRPMRIDGGGLDSWWRGRFAVRGTVAAPDVVGEMNVDRGAFTFIGQTFTLDSGKLVQTGGRRIDPEINAVGTRQNADIVATVTVTGRASAPRIELSSRPALPRDEVLARLLFQKRAAQLGAIESVQLANAAAELAGVSRGGLGGALQRTLGVDTLGLGGQSGSALVVGQRIGRNLYVGVEQDLRGTGRQIVLEWRLSRTLSLRSATNDETGADIGLSWRKDY